MKTFVAISHNTMSYRGISGAEITIIGEEPGYARAANGEIEQIMDVETFRFVAGRESLEQLRSRLGDIIAEMDADSDESFGPLPHTKRKITPPKMKPPKKEYYR